MQNITWLWLSLSLSLNYFQGLFFFHKLITFHQLSQKGYVLKRVWLISHLPLLRAGLEPTTLGKRRDQSTRRKIVLPVDSVFQFTVFAVSGAF